MSHHRGSPIQPVSIGSVTYCSSTTVNESHWREIELSNHEGIHSRIKFLIFVLVTPCDVEEVDKLLSERSSRWRKTLVEDKLWSSPSVLGRDFLAVSFRLLPRFQVGDSFTSVVPSSMSV
ncbi:hypothetical protein F2Q69_00031702 [Brassica cretica]|uniref:Uncharacterized protein n=1 Tax=Brassica cretica TaxID=69181 RepID=A0A8S9S3R9_BRACR|nr:hypothetical protein F2Q69_00031702 [Brassica cretica]